MLRARVYTGFSRTDPHHRVSLACGVRFSFERTGFERSSVFKYKYSQRILICRTPAAAHVTSVECTVETLDRLEPPLRLYARPFVPYRRYTLSC